MSAEDRIIVSDVETGETVNDFKGRLVFAGLIPLFDRPVVLLASGEEDLEFIDVETGQQMRKIEGGFCKVFRAVVSYDDSCPIMVYTTWNAQNRRSTIQTYDLSGLGGSGGGMVQSAGARASATAAAAAADETAESTTWTGKRASNGTQCDGNQVVITEKIDKTIGGELYKTEKITSRELYEGRMHIMFEGDSKDGVTSLAVSRAKQPVIVSGHYDFNVRVWELTSRKLLYILEDHKDWVVSVALWKGMESMAVSGSSDGTIKLWDLNHGKLLTTCEGHLRDVWSVTVTEGKKPLIVSASVDRTMRSWDINHYLLDLKWYRRRPFCLFLVGCGLLGRGTAPRSSGTDSSGGSNSDSNSGSGNDGSGSNTQPNEINESTVGDDDADAVIAFDGRGGGESPPLTPIVDDDISHRLLSLSIAPPPAVPTSVPRRPLSPSPPPPPHPSEGMLNGANSQPLTPPHLVFQSVHLCAEIAAWL